MDRGQLERLAVTSKAGQLVARLRELRWERKVALDEPPTLPLLDARDPPLIVSGVAGRTLTYDCDRIRVAPGRFGARPPPALSRCCLSTMVPR